MALWISVALLTVVVGGMLALALLRPAGRAGARADYDLSVYKDQLAEVDRDVERGLLSADQAEATRTEIKRRMLAASADGAAIDAEAPRKSGAARGLAVAVPVLVGVAAVGFYLVLGTPQQPDMPYAARDINQERDHVQAAEIAEMVATLAQRLEKNPDDLQGWRMLGRSYMVMERFDEAAEALGRAAAMTNFAPDVATDYAEALIFAAQGNVPLEARRALEKALEQAPRYAKARFFLAHAKREAGDLRGALQEYVDMLAIASSDVSWRPQVVAARDETAEALGIDPSSVKPSEGLGATGSAASAASTGTEASPSSPAAATTAPTATRPDPAAMVARLAARLEENPDDIEGWMRLGRSYMVLERYDEAVEALARAAEMRPDDIKVLNEYASAILEAEGGRDEVPASMVPVLERIERIEPGNSNALWYLGLYNSTTGNAEAARSYWNRLLAQFDPGTLPYERLKAQIDALGTGG